MKLPGFVDVNKLIKEYKQAHIFLLPSVIKTQGVVLQEAQATGLPVIATKTGGSSECIEDKVTSFLISPEDLNNIVEKVKVSDRESTKMV